MARSKTFLSRLWRALAGLVLLFVVLSVLAVVLLRWINPPFSAFMAEQRIEAWVTRDRDYVFRHTWVDLAQISPNLPLAVVA